MKLLRLTDEYEVEIERETLAIIPEFAALFTLNYNKQEGDYDGRARRRAKKELAWLYFMHDYRSEYIEYSDEERNLKALEAAELPPDYIFSSELKAATVKFIALQETRELKLLKAAYGTIDRMRTYFDGVIIKDGNVKNTLAALSTLGSVFEGLKKLEEQVRKAERSEGRTRGDHERGRQT